MRSSRLVTLGLVAVLTLVAGMALGQSEPKTVLEDAPDDGRAERFESYPVAQNFGCIFYSGQTVTCSQVPPARELTRVAMTDTSQYLTVRLEVAGLSEDLEDAAGEHSLTEPEAGEPTDPNPKPASKRHSTVYLVCWNGEDGDCSQGVSMWIRRIHGEIVTRSHLWVSGGDCPDDISCQYEAPHTIETGEPGVVEWRVPRQLVPGTDAGDEIDQAVGAIYRLDDRDHMPGVEFGALCSTCGLQPAGFLDGHDTVDVAGEGEGYTFRTETADQLPARFRSDRVSDARSDVPGPEQPDLDALEVAFDVDEDNVTVSMKKAAVREDPADQYIWLNFGLMEDIPFIQARSIVEDGERRFEADLWEDFDRSPEEIDATGTVTTGEPGWVNVTLPLSQAPVRDHRIAWMWAGVFDWRDDEPGAIGEAMGAQDAVHLSRYQWDSVGPGTAYRFTVSEPALNTTDETANATNTSVSKDEGLPDLSTVQVVDESTDAELPPDASPQQTIRETVGSDEDGQREEDAYEITRVEARAESDTLVGMTLGIKELQRISVPQGYDAAVYGAALQTEDGMFMVGRYEEQSGPRGTLVRELPTWFCAADTMVLTDSPQLPPQANAIDEGFVRTSQASSSNRSEETGAGDPAEIEFQEVPRECLGDAPPGPLDIEVVGAGTFLVRDTNPNDPGSERAEVVAVDPAQETVNETIEPPEESSEGLAASGLQTPSEDSGFAEPFGIDNFWDIAGITGTILASVIGAVLVRRRRGALKDYLEEIDRIIDDHQDDPSGRQAALLALRGEAKDDLVDGRLTENQYVVVKDRISEEVSEARLEGIEDAFGQLPHRLLGKLKTMVANGGLSPEDRRLFLTMLEDSGLNEEAKARVRRKLDIWVDGSSDRADATA